MNLSQKGLDLIKQFEGLRLKAYKALNTEKYYTIGYGHYGSDVKKDETITKAQAESLLKKDVKRFVDGVNDGIKIDVNQNQFDALVSFAYNVGLGAFKSSTLLEKLNKKDYEGASREFARWNKSGGKVIQGLINRRAEEKELFLAKVPEKKPPEKSPVKEATKKQYITYTIKLGDTLSEIAQRYDSSVKELKSINRISDEDRIYAGNKIKIPKS
jgi:GH24 family phage-related lysozyme (muramidase)